MKPTMRALFLAAMMVLQSACAFEAEEDDAEEELGQLEAGIVKCQASGVCSCAGFWPWQLYFYDKSCNAEGATFAECCEAGETDLVNKCAALEIETGMDCGLTNIRKQCRLIES